MSFLVVVTSNIGLGFLFYFYLRTTPRTLRSDDISLRKRGLGLASMLILLAFATYIPAPFLKGKWDFGVPEQFALPYALFCWIFAQMVVGSIFGKIGKERIIFERFARDRRKNRGG